MPRYRVQAHGRGISLLHLKFYIYDFTFLCCLPNGNIIFAA